MKPADIIGDNLGAQGDVDSWFEEVATKAMEGDIPTIDELHRIASGSHPDADEFDRNLCLEALSNAPSAVEMTRALCIKFLESNNRSLRFGALATVGAWKRIREGHNDTFDRLLRPLLQSEDDRMREATASYFRMRQRSAIATKGETK